MNYLDVCPLGFDSAKCSDAFIAEYCKAWRNRQLAASDWTQLSDAPVTNKAAWAAYRQELRDLPKQDADPKKWVFPEEP